MNYRSAFANLPEGLLAEARVAVQDSMPHESPKRRRTWGELEDDDTDFISAVSSEVLALLSNSPNHEFADQTVVL